MSIKSETVTVQPGAEYVKVGNLEIISHNGLGRGTTMTIDGRIVPATRVVLEVDVRGAWLATVSYFPCVGEWGPEAAK